MHGLNAVPRLQILNRTGFEFVEFQKHDGHRKYKPVRCMHKLNVSGLMPVGAHHAGSKCVWFNWHWLVAGFG